MAKPISVYCPSCDAELKVRDPRTFGKKVRCPDCEAPFIVRPPRARASGVDDVDHDYNRGDENSRRRYHEEYEPRRTRSRPPAPPRRTSRQSTDPGNQAVLVALGVLLGLLFLVGGGFLIYHLAGEKPGDAGDAGGLAERDDAKGNTAAREFPVAQNLNRLLDSKAPIAAPPIEWLSSKTQILVSVDVDRVWGSPVTQGVLDHPAAVLKKFEVERAVKEIGLSPGESLEAIDSLHIGLEHAERKAFAEGVAVIRKKTPWDVARVTRQADARESIHQGKTYYLARLLAYYFPDPNTCLVGPARFVEEAIARGPNRDAARKFAFAPQGQIVIGMAPDDPAVFTKGANLGGSPLERKIGSAMANIETSAFSFDLTSRIEMDVSWDFHNSHSAGEMADALQFGLGEMRRAIGQLQSNGARLPPQMRDILQAAEPILNSAVTRERGNQVTLSAQVPSAVIHQIVRLVNEQQRGRFSGFGPGDLF